MANYYSIHIHSPKVSQDFALEMLQYLASCHKIEHFEFEWNDSLYIYMRGYSELCPLLRKYDFDESDYTKVMSETDLAYQDDYPDEDYSIWTFEKEDEEGE